MRAFLLLRHGTLWVSTIQRSLKAGAAATAVSAAAAACCRLLLLPAAVARCRCGVGRLLTGSRVQGKIECKERLTFEHTVPRPAHQNGYFLPARPFGYQ